VIAYALILASTAVAVLVAAPFAVARMGLGE
jgi:hypothetical protein